MYPHVAQESPCSQESASDLIVPAKSWTHFSRWTELDAVVSLTTIVRALILYDFYKVSLKSPEQLPLGWGHIGKNSTSISLTHHPWQISIVQHISTRYIKLPRKTEPRSSEPGHVDDSLILQWSQLRYAHYKNWKVQQLKTSPKHPRKENIIPFYK